MLGEVDNLCHIVKHRLLMPCAKFDGKSLTTFKVIVKKTFVLLFYGCGLV